VEMTGQLTMQIRAADRGGATGMGGLRNTRPRTPSWGGPTPNRLIEANEAGFLNALAE
jgi:hypothetical protein